MSEELLDGRTAIVTGGGSGIGRAIALELVSAGVGVAITGRRAEALEETRNMAGAGARILTVPGDIRDEASRVALVGATVDHFGGLDILVNNAGVTAMSAFLDYTVEDWRAVHETHSEAAFFLSQASAKELRNSDQGRIVNIGSVYGSLAINNDYYGDSLPWETPNGRGPVREFAYAATKGGVLQLTRELATALAPWGITVNSVTPGMIPVSANPLGDTTQDRLSKMTPLGRVGRPEEIASVVRFVASERASFMTGSEIRVDGGWSIW